MREGRFEREGLGFRYREWNPGATALPPVLLLHGLSSNAAIWNRVAARLTSRRLIALDQRAHGGSASPPTGYEPALLAADAAALLAGLGISRAVVAGHSWGATIALQLAADRPDLVAGLAIVDGPTRSWSEAGITWEQTANLMQPPLPAYPDLEAALAEKRAILKEAWAGDLDLYVAEGLVPEASGWRLPLTAPIRLQVLRAMYEQPYAMQWPLVACPVLLALAEGGPSSWQDQKRRSAAAVTQQVPQAVLHWYQSGHDIPLEKPEELAADLERLCLRAGFADVNAEIAAIAGDWSAPTGYELWSGHDLLAHLTSTAAALPAVVRTRRSTTVGRDGEPFDSDRWNASQVRRRQDRSPAELIAELESSAAELDPLLAELPVEERLGAGPYAGKTTADGMNLMVEHQREHLAELRRSLTPTGDLPANH